MIAVGPPPKQLPFVSMTFLINSKEPSWPRMEVDTSGQQSPKVDGRPGGSVLAQGLIPQSGDSEVSSVFGL